MTLPRELALVREGNDLVLIQRLPAELASLRGTGQSWANETIQRGKQSTRRCAGGDGGDQRNVPCR